MSGSRGSPAGAHQATTPLRATTPLEGRYRRVLRLLPAAYRAVWEEEMVATFLDSMASDDPEEHEWLTHCGRPSRSEVASVAALAVRLRLGGTEAPPRSFLWGEAVRLVAQVGLLVNAVGAAGSGGVMLWLAGWLPWPPVPNDIAALASTAPAESWSRLWDLTGLCWIAAYFALLVGRCRVAKALAGLALLPAVVGLVVASVSTLLGRPGPPVSSLVLTMGADLSVNVVLVLALAAFHRDAPPLRRRPWLVAFCVGVALSPLPAAAFLLQPTRDLVLLDGAGVWAVAFLVAAAAHLAGPGSPHRRRAPSWSLALALLAAPVLALRLLSLLDYTVFGAAGMDLVTVILGVVEAFALVAVGIPLLVLAGRALRGASASSTQQAPTPL